MPESKDPHYAHLLIEPTGNSFEALDSPYRQVIVIPVPHRFVIPSPSRARNPYRAEIFPVAAAG
jgi:hypothetical protein